MGSHNQLSDPDQVLDCFEAAWAARDAQAIADLFVDDPEFVNVTGMWWSFVTDRYLVFRVIVKSSRCCVTTQQRWRMNRAATG